MQEHNPYSTPSANLSGQDSFSTEQGVTQGVVEQLARTKGWTRFLGILCILLGGFMILGAVGGGASFSQLGASNLPGGTFLAVLMGVYLLAGGIYLVAGVKLNGFSSAVSRLIYSGKQRDLEDALDRQRSFWLFTGILGILLTIAMVLGLVGTITGTASQSEALLEQTSDE